MVVTVRAARLIAGFTQEEMAEKLGVCRDTYRKYEKQPQAMPMAIAQAFSNETGIPLDEILFAQYST